MAQHAAAAAMLGPSADAEHESAMAVLAARRLASAQAKARVEEAARSHAAAVAQALAAEKTAVATERAVLAAEQKPVHWFATKTGDVMASTHTTYMHHHPTQYAGSFLASGAGGQIVMPIS